MKNWFSTILLIPLLVVVMACAGFMGYIKWQENEYKKFLRHPWHKERVTFVQFSARQVCCMDELKLDWSKGDFHIPGETFFGGWSITNISDRTIELNLSMLNINARFKKYVKHMISVTEATLEPGQTVQVRLLGYIDPIVLNYKIAKDRPDARSVLISLPILEKGVDYSEDLYFQKWVAPK